MKRVPRAIYQTAAEVEERVRRLESDAMKLQVDTPEYRAILIEISKLRVYADAKRWLAGPSKQNA